MASRPKGERNLVADLPVERLRQSVQPYDPVRLCTRCSRGVSNSRGSGRSSGLRHDDGDAVVRVLVGPVRKAVHVSSLTPPTCSIAVRS